LSIFAAHTWSILPGDDPQARNTSDGSLRFHSDGRPVLPGWDHACMAASKLQGVAASVRVLELFKRQRKEDACDWAQQGGVAEALYDLVEREARAWPFEPPFVSKFQAIPWDELDASGPEHEWLVKGMLTRGERSMMVGPSQSGKSFVAIDMALSIARGVEYFGRKTLRGGVVYQAGASAGARSVPELAVGRRGQPLGLADGHTGSGLQLVHADRRRPTAE
jgi:hypothetical protein